MNNPYHGDPFTIRIFVPDGDPEGVRIIDRMNWTGLGIAFPRSKWQDVKQRAEFKRTGVYILVGYQGQDDDLPTLYIGQADGVGTRLDSHYQSKDFWDWGIVFVSNSGGLNRAHVTWLEHALVNRVTKTKRCHLDNGNIPQEPALTEAEKADTQGFLGESPTTGRGRVPFLLCSRLRRTRGRVHYRLCWLPAPQCLNDVDTTNVLNQATQHWHTGRTRKRAISACP
jgi:hypothetical protein